MTNADELLTPRLRLRRWRPADEATMAAINRDPEISRYLNRPVDPAAIAPFTCLVQDHWRDHGFGFWALEVREPEAVGRFIGFVGVAYPTFLSELATRPELGWRLARHAWGRGLATEAAEAARDNAFGALACPELISIIHPENARSRRLATRLGMTLEQHVHNPALKRDVDVWQLVSPQH